MAHVPHAALLAAGLVATMTVQAAPQAAWAAAGDGVEGSDGDGLRDRLRDRRQWDCAILQVCGDVGPCSDSDPGILHLRYAPDGTATIHFVAEAVIPVTVHRIPGATVFVGHGAGPDARSSVQMLTVTDSGGGSYVATGTVSGTASATGYFWSTYTLSCQPGAE